MSKFCIYCGTTMDDSDNVCPSCGKETGKNDDTAVLPIEKKKSLKPKLISAVVILIIAAIVALIVFLMFRDSYKKPLENLCSALEKGDDDDFYDALPAYVEDSLSDKNRRIIRNNLKIAMLTLENKCGEDIEVSYAIMDDNGVEKLDADVLGKMEKALEKEHEEDVDISKGYSVTLKVNISGDEQKISSPYFTVNVYRIDGRWCVNDKEAAETFIENASSFDFGNSPDINDLIDEKVKELL